MKPAAFELEMAQTVDEAIALLSDGGRDVKVLAGGQSLVPLLNFRLARPEVLVDLNSIPELQYIREHAGGLAIGAMTRLRALEESADVARLAPLITEALPSVGHAPIRNRGTFGGSLAHADPAAELCTVALALDATLVARSRQGERIIPIDQFFVGPFTTTLRGDELLTEIRLPAFPSGAGWAFQEVARRRGDFAMVAVAAVVLVEPRGNVSSARLAYTSMGPTPLRARRAEAQLIGQPADADTFACAAEAAVSELDPGDDFHASREYRTQVAQALTRRVLAAALERTQDSRR
jgi:aerobic carbon-monoxide dehydrogenase medium subunit